ncbi:MAG: T9SS type A sorting domain-containing protein, partial [Bacteroidota bacterium]
GIQELNGTWALYPSPTEGTLYVRGLNQPKLVEIFDLSGRKLTLVLDYKDGDQINVMSLSTGIYQVSIEGKIQRFIKL